MRAAWYETTGAAADVLQTGELDDPTAGPGEVRVRIHASGVNPADAKRRGGLAGDIVGPRYVPHFDGAGVIDAAGDGVDPSRVGERVWLHSAQLGRPYGTAAEYVVVPERLAVPLPAATSFVEAACLGIPALTAHQTVLTGATVKGRTVLVTGGAGAVGHYAIQFAKWAGARVIATVSGPEKELLAREAGADEVINYRGVDVGAAVRELTGDHGVDRIVEVAFGENIELDADLLAVGGTIASYASDTQPEPVLPFHTLVTKNATLYITLVFLQANKPLQQAIDTVTQLLETDVLQHNVQRAYSLDQIAAAHEAVEAGDVPGNIVIQVD